MSDRRDAHVVTITAPGGETWTAPVSPAQATAVWRYLRIVGGAMTTTGIGYLAAGRPKRHGEAGPSSA